MDISIISADGSTRINTIRADSLATAEKLHPGLRCVPRGSVDDMAAQDMPQPDAPALPEVVTRAQLSAALAEIKGKGGRLDDADAVWAEAVSKGLQGVATSQGKV